MENNLKKLRDGRTIAHLAKQTGINRNTIASYEKGTTPTLDKADIIAHALGVTIYDIWPALKSRP